MKMNGMEHEMLMPGMLTDEKMAALDRARGPEFDRLFLQGMIRHHQGAIDMVDTLFKSYGAAQDETVFKFANDVQSDPRNPQDQQWFVWPPSFALARAYLDQLERSNGLASVTIASARASLAAAEGRTGAARRTVLTQLASRLNTSAAGARDRAKVKRLPAAVTDLANGR